MSEGSMLDGVHIENGIVDVNGTADAIVLDADGDTSISSPTDDQIDFEIAGADDFTMTANSFNVLAGSTIAGPSSTFAIFEILAAPQAVSMSAGINITTPTTYWTTTGAGATSGLTDGVIKGHRKRIMLAAATHPAELTPSNLSGGTKLTFSIVGDYVDLLWNGSNWVPVAIHNQATGSTATPVLA
jgi:hypothetical protein